MKKLFFILLFLTIAKKGFSQGSVDVVVDPDVQTMEETRIANNKARGMKIYRIMVAFYPTRSAANEKLTEVRMWFGAKYGATMIFDEPNFKVYVGEFSSKSDAETALLEVKKRYHSARVVNDYATYRGGH